MVFVNKLYENGSSKIPLHEEKKKDKVKNDQFPFSLFLFPVI